MTTANSIYKHFKFHLAKVAGIKDPQLPSIFAAADVPPPSKGALECWGAGINNRIYKPMPESAFADFILGLARISKKDDRVKKAVESAFEQAHVASIDPAMVSVLRKQFEG